MKAFLVHVRDAHAQRRNDKSPVLVSLCDKLLHDLEEKVSSAILIYRRKLQAACVVSIMVWLG
jgi:hypothetical protein